MSNIEKFLLRDSILGCDVGKLIYDHEQRHFIIEPIPPANPEQLKGYPLLLQEAVKRGLSRLPDSWTSSWVSSHVVPPERIGVLEKLRSYGYSEYSEFAVMKISGGHNNMDNTYLVPLE